MKNLKLKIDLLPKGAWGNNLSHILPKKDWDTVRNYVYAKADNRCEICGYKPKEEGELDAHEEWEFDMISNTQTLKNIISLCSRCHGVKHMRNSERLGYGENAKKHFLKVNKCDEMTFANHVFQSQMLFEERNEIYRWKLDVASLHKFDGKGIDVKQRNIPLIKSPYEGVDWNNVKFSEMKSLFVLLESKDSLGSPIVTSIEVDNYQGVITVVALFSNKIDWSLDGELIKTKYNVVGKFKTEFKVENLECSKLRFRLTGDGGTTISKIFELKNSTNKLAKNYKELL